LIKGEIFKQLPKKAIVALTYMYDAAFQLKYVPRYWKTAEVIIIPKPGKPASEISCYRPVVLAVACRVVSRIEDKTDTTWVVLRNLNLGGEMWELIFRNILNFRKGWRKEMQRTVGKTYK
jgi:hypothetical protein